ncbi:hypothetical protein [Vibrio crassostreae]|uniref:hypothetical protein n=1 Tax=Vibrio crassostreae TaxID=246167 RepID=UPI0010E57C19|nr:hypothetical protein [Vibrio crassostreae]TCO05762.1 hypothetical protein EDB30_102340 [Vibrio crassostreae]CAK2389035.1 hypothetical protein VCRA2116O372_90073 [Vibrio crassostreae]CAK2585970.1 hypothetical protein VCRA2116O374_80073 [Vibrio crassostreae]CAK2597607.1 hypothetical protein VCRA2117O377_90073 [Vibrio crassostreae]CAK2784182.1 hypothetical protein VCRA2119O384_20073 [Vibrio crassostreae]
MKNKLVDLNNHLFAQMECLSDENITDDKLNEEINHSKTLTTVSRQIIDNVRLALDTKKFRTEYAGRIEDLPIELKATGHAIAGLEVATFNAGGKSDEYAPHRSSHAVKSW